MVVLVLESGRRNGAGKEGQFQGKMWQRWGGRGGGRESME
jgi:hypothetical protein